MRLTVVLPGFAEHVATVREEVGAWAGHGVGVDVVAAAVPDEMSASRYGLAAAGPAILAEVVRAAHSGSDGVMIDCAAEPVVHAAREVVDVPVVGGLLPALHVAMNLGLRVGVLTTLPSAASVFRQLLAQEGVSGRCRVLTVPFGSGESGFEKEALVRALNAGAVQAVTSDEADVLVLSCTGLSGATRAVQDHLAERGPFVPVVDLTGAALMLLESMVRLGVHPSRTAYSSVAAPEGW
ncbi:aspartate/glutamate racemase family protein [Streptomyces niger]|uniref:aspartate/glutamate racemase family protein n=1 Tax=Streptomyces niger TaxID=66373 RepID=UPI0018FE353D|nr:aspartate/glutamate racemase family protein [Streptomyces niger]